MSEEPAQPIVLDTTVLSNFASVDAIDWLIETFERPIVVPAVRDELEEGEDAGHMFLTAAIDPLEDELPVHEIADAKSADHPDYVAPLDPGESESLRAAEEQDGTLASDDHEYILTTRQPELSSSQLVDNSTGWTRRYHGNTPVREIPSGDLVGAHSGGQSR